MEMIRHLLLLVVTAEDWRGKLDPDGTDTLHLWSQACAVPRETHICVMTSGWRCW